jgi:hypothetical protein
MNVREYLEQCRPLSLTARSAISLLVFEKYCAENDLNILAVTELLDHMWKWPLIDGPDQFEPWESQRPLLIDCGLGDDFPDDLIAILAQRNISESKFRTVIEGVTEILWSSFWGAAENEASINDLEKVLLVTNVQKLPTLTPFKFSLFSDKDGWGSSLTAEDRDFWRRGAKYA